MIRSLLIAAVLLSAVPSCIADQGSFELSSASWLLRISHRNPHIRRRAAEEAKVLPLAQVRGQLWNALRYDKDDETVGRVAVTLAWMVTTPVQKDVDALLAAFERVKLFYARGRVALSLGKFASKLSSSQEHRVLVIFIDWILNRRGNAKRYVAASLGMFGAKAKSAIPALEMLQKHPWAQTRKAATKALKQIRKP